MNPMKDMGKFLIIAGVIFAAMGFVLWSGFGRNWLGRFPAIFTTPAAISVFISRSYPACC